MICESLQGLQIHRRREIKIKKKVPPRQGSHTMGGCERLIKKHIYPWIITYLLIGYPNKTISLLGPYKLNIYYPITIIAIITIIMV